MSNKVSFRLDTDPGCLSLHSSIGNKRKKKDTIIGLITLQTSMRALWYRTISNICRPNRSITKTT